MAGGPRPVQLYQGGQTGNSIVLTIDGTRSDLGGEGYDLRISTAGATLTAATARGLGWGVQTVRQLAHATAPNGAPAGQVLSAGQRLTAVEITDSPRFSWRGLHLDVSRHFFPPAFIERLLDVMALYKLNTFHWHLTDDHGWRLEIESYPRLDEVGSRRTSTPRLEAPTVGDGKPHAGYYTQAEVRGLVEYAAARGITIVPEIDMPGHTLAALASYPELGCHGSGYEVGTSWGHGSDVLCPGRESTFTFVEGVLAEVLDLFPSERIHIATAAWCNARTGFVASKPPGRGNFVGQARQLLRSLGPRAVSDLERPRSGIVDGSKGTADRRPIQTAMGGRPVVVLRVLMVHVLEVSPLQTTAGSGDLFRRVSVHRPGVASVDDEPQLRGRIAVH